MEEQTQQILVDLVERAVSGVDRAVEFSQAQIPDVIEQLLMWKFWESMMWNIPSLLILFFILAMYVFAFSPKGWCSQVNGWKEKFEVIRCYVLGTPIFLFLAWLFCNFDWLKILIAPKLYLIEYAASLVK